MERKVAKTYQVTNFSKKLLQSPIAEQHASKGSNKIQRMDNTKAKGHAMNKRIIPG
jgi:hypothetical protein